MRNPGSRLPGQEERDPGALWQRANEAALRARLERVIAAPDDTLFTASWNDSYVVVTKEEGYVRLWIMEQDADDTEWVQSALWLDNPLHLVLTYTQAMMLALVWQPEPARVFMSGLGGGGLALVLHHHLWRTQIDCVEIAPPVVEAAQRFFGFATDERMALCVDDAARFLARQPRRSYEILFLDLFTDAGETPAHLSGPDFFHMCRERLRPGGLLTMNLGADSPGYPARLAAIESVFPTVYTCRGYGSTQVIFATDRPPIARAACIQQAAALQRAYGFSFPLPAWSARLRRRQPPPTLEENG
ncbi:MAG: hypothetical protein D6790_12230 [Caldilineae bacterium]|nr:MAG: hypothetical protein D6790_12230 [Caldilineae bacterium]